MAEKKIAEKKVIGKKMNYFLFGSSAALERFLKRKMAATVEDKIEWCVMEKFPGNRILFTAEHAATKKLPMGEFGDRAYVGIGDKNTGILAKLGAYYLHSAYLTPLFLRTEADAARPIEDLGKGLRLFVKIFYAKQKTTYVPIHAYPSMLPYLKRYHQLIEQLNPKAIVSVHGMHVKRKFDVLFGFGEGYEAIGGKRQAFKFKNEFTDYLDKIFGLVGLSSRLQIAVSTWLLKGSRNYILTKHVIEHNKKHGKKRLGLQVEFNWRGRVMEGDRAVPTIPYQLVVQSLGDFVYKWMNTNF